MRLLGRLVFSKYNDLTKIARRSTVSIVHKRFLSHYPIDENIFGLTDEQRQVIHLDSMWVINIKIMLNCVLFV